MDGEETIFILFWLVSNKVKVKVKVVYFNMQHFIHGYYMD